jgi:DNA primase
MDPDDLARSDPEKLKTLIAEAKSLLEFLIDQIRERHQLERPEGRLRFLDEIAPVLRAEPDPVRRDVYISAVAGATGVDPALVRQRVEAAPAPTVGRPSGQAAAPAAPLEAPEAQEMKQTPLQERYVMALLTRYPEEIARADLVATDLATPELRDLLKFLQSGQRPSSDLPAHLAATAAALGAIAPELGEEADPGQVIEIAARRLRVQTLRDRLGEARAKLAQATGGDASALAVEVERIGGELDLAMARVERRTVLHGDTPRTESE